MDKSEKLGALSSLMASYAAEDEDDSQEDEAVAAEEDEVVQVSSRQLASEILDCLVTKAFQGRPDAFTAVQEPSSSSDDDEGSDSGNEESKSNTQEISVGPSIEILNLLTILTGC